jgi:hypothetical protein
VQTNRSNSESQTKKFNRCTLNVRDLPLERFRLQSDGRKWKQAARSRSNLLLKLATYANPDGTFESEDRKKNFSPSTKKLQQHYAKRTLYRLSNDLSRLGLLSWEREKNHYGRRTYRIYFRPEKQVPHSQDQVPHSQKTGATMAPDNRSHHGTCYQGSHSPESQQSTGLADSSSTGPRLLESLPSERERERQRLFVVCHPNAAAAFLAIGFDRPFGHYAFQEVWLRQFTARKNGEWLTEVMESTFQECQRKGIKVPHLFGEAKRNVERYEQIEYDQKHGKPVPL